MTTRQISIFTRPDGNVVHDRPWDPDAPSGTVQPNPSSDTLWPLIKVFLQFSREVQGGSVHRLVFRSPSEYTPEPQVFRPALVPRPRKDPLVAHIAHDDLFVVVVTEISPKGSIVSEDDEATEGIAEFCHTVKDYLNTQQTAFLATLNACDYKSNRGMENDTSGLGQSTGGTEQDSREAPAPAEEKPAGGSERPVVTVNQTRLGEFIAKTQTMLQL